MSIADDADYSSSCGLIRARRFASSHEIDEKYRQESAVTCHVPAAMRQCSQVIGSCISQASTCVRTQ